jgi:hypothetical protein
VRTIVAAGAAGRSAASERAPALSAAVAAGSGGDDEQAASNPRITAHRLPRKSIDMWVILLEALGALALLVLIVWWTMFSGRRKGERSVNDDAR